MRWVNNENYDERCGVGVTYKKTFIMWRENMRVWELIHFYLSCGEKTCARKSNLKLKSRGQGGLLDILCKDDVIFVSYSEDHGKFKSTTSIARANLDRGELKFDNI